jgi:hypothetical protein
MVVHHQSVSNPQLLIALLLLHESFALAQSL